MANPRPKRPQIYCKSCAKAIPPNTHECPHCGKRTRSGQEREMRKGKTLEQLATWNLSNKMGSQPHKPVTPEPVMKAARRKRGITLTGKYVGTGLCLFHISLMADSFEYPTMHLVAADSADEAQQKAQAQYPGVDFDPTLQDGYKIGEFD